MQRANVIGSGPNGLAAAIALARAGVEVHLFERLAHVGGACSSGEATLPGFVHDLGASALPMAVSSPFFNSVPLARYGFRYIQPELSLAHPFEDGSAVALTPSLDEMSTQFPRDDARAWQRLFNPLVEDWRGLAREILGPVVHIPKRPLKLARFGLQAVLPATTLARALFAEKRAQALFGGCAGHSVMPLDGPLSSAICLVLAAAGHADGWPVAAGGSQSLADALGAHLRALGGMIHLEQSIEDVNDFNPKDLLLFDTSVPALERIAGDRFPGSFRDTLMRFKQGPGVFKIDWALSEPIPWTAPECRRAGTVHVGGTLEEIARAEREVFAGGHSERPFLILVQPSLADPSRAPARRHTAWAYCHVPNSSTLDQTQAIESQIERFAPGFHDVVLARRSWSTAQLEAWNPNLVGGDLSGGAMTVKQMLLRPSVRDYGTSDPRIFLCSSATSPGGGIHGMCGFHAAQLALSTDRRRRLR